eukprot:6147519-Pyramimonas_sp.AAC.1
MLGLGRRTCIPAQCVARAARERREATRGRLPSEPQQGRWFPARRAPRAAGAPPGVARGRAGHPNA